jgi:predicted flavoprotein YhiN
MDVMIIGAGAAGLTSAIFAAKNGANVILLERTDKPGKKILMSGGTRCNVLPVEMSLSDYFTDSSPNLLKRIFKSWSLTACKNWFEQDLKLDLSCEIESNKWFPTSNSAKEVRDVLVDEALRLGVQFRYNTPVSQIRQTVDGWTVIDETGHVYSAEKLIVATGGLSVPTIGTDGMGHKFLQKIRVPVGSTYPALTPLTGMHPAGENLAGISLNVRVSVRDSGVPPNISIKHDTEDSVRRDNDIAGCRVDSVGLGTDLVSRDNDSARHSPQQKPVFGESNREGFLFTHKGYSGPAILDVSHHATRYLTGLTNKPQYLVNWTSEDAETWKNRLGSGRSTVRGMLREHLPNRLADAITAEHPSPDKRIAELSKLDREKLIELLTAYPLKWSSNEGYKKAEVTGGGVPLEAIDTATMQVKGYEGLYLCGEILDVFGRIGGFNFYWAWVTGRLAGMSVVKKN